MKYKQYCSLDKCCWISADGKCRWPSSRCPRAEERGPIQVVAMGQKKTKKTPEQKSSEIIANKYRQESDYLRAATGVYSECGKYRACIFINGKSTYVGRYGTLEEAQFARDEAMKHKAAGDLDKWLDDHRIHEHEEVEYGPSNCNHI